MQVIRLSQGWCRGELSEKLTAQGWTVSVCAPPSPSPDFSPDPHHPWDVPFSEMLRLNWKDVPLPSLYCETDAERRALLKDKPKHWLGYYEGSLWTNLESPREFIPAELTPDQVREINAITHIENELIDEACGRVLGWLDDRGWVSTVLQPDVFLVSPLYLYPFGYLSDGGK